MSRQAAEAKAMHDSFPTDELLELERNFPDGMSAQAIVDILAEHGIAIVASTFRKYVQLGLLPRSRRVGRKGKHQGSHGLYPAAVVGRIIEIRRLMDEGLTLEEIQRSAVALRIEIDAVRGLSDAVLEKLEEEAIRRLPERGAVVEARVVELRRQALALVSALERAAAELCPPQALAPGGGMRSAQGSSGRMPGRERARGGRERRNAREGIQ